MNTALRKNGFANITLWATAFIYIGFSIWLATRPDDLLSAFGITHSTPQMRTEIRAFYGGIELGIAGVMILLWRMKQAAIGLIVGGVPLAGSALGRFLGMSLEGIDSTHLVLAGFELLGSFTCLLAAYLHGSMAPRK